MKNKDLEWIKKHYSESLMRICRKLFPTFLEYEGLLPKILFKEFAPTKVLGDMISLNNCENDFKSYIFSKVNIKQKNTDVVVTKTPAELLNQAGYILFPECKTEQDVQKFKKFYKSGEELCTFNNDRLDKCRIWFAVKKNINNIKRENFSKPIRQDEYGTSVISIQFSKTYPQTLSIKNRYNHTVDNPDATFSNNLDNIIPGLAKAFMQTYGITLLQNNQESDIFDCFVLGDDGKKYFSLKEVNNIHYCENNVIVDNGHVVKLDKQFQIVDGYVFDFKNKTISRYEDIGKKDIKKDAFINSFGNIKWFEISKINEQEKFYPEEDKKLTIKVENGENIELRLNKFGELTSLYNPNIEKVESNFLTKMSIKKIDLPNLKECENNCFNNLKNIEIINLNSLKQCKNNCFNNLKNIETIKLNQLQQCGDECFNKCKNLKSLELPLLKQCKSECFAFLNDINLIKLDSLTKCESKCFYDCKNINTIQIPQLEKCEDDCFKFIENNENIFLNSLQKCGNECFFKCKNIKQFNLPLLQQCENECFCYLSDIKNVKLNSLIKCGNESFGNLTNIKNINLNKLQTCNNNCFFNLKNIEMFLLSTLKQCENNCFCDLKNINTLQLPALKKCGNDCFFKIEFLNLLNISLLTESGDDCFEDLKNIKSIKTNFLPQKQNLFLK